MMDNENNLNMNAIAILSADELEQTIMIARAACPFAEAASDEMMAICIGFVEVNGDLEQLEVILGFSKNIVRRQTRTDLGQRIIGQLSKSNLRGTGFMTAVNTFMSIANSQSAASAARVKAAENLLQLVEAEEQANGKKSGGGSKDLNQMTLTELQDFVSGMASQVTMIEGTIDNESNEQPDALDKP